MTQHAAQTDAVAAISELGVEAWRAYSHSVTMGFTQAAFEAFGALNAYAECAALLTPMTKSEVITNWKYEYLTNAVL